VGALAEAMPRGARSVEDLLIAGCSSGGESMMEKYQGMFPNAKAIMADDGSSPGAASGATAHQKAWEQATRGSKDTLSRAAFQGMRKGENVTVWTKTHGFDDGKPPADVADLRAARAQHEAAFQAAWTGQTPITDSQRGPVRDFYSATHRLIQNPNTPPAERQTLEGQRNQTIRLLYYGPVSQRFQEAYGARVDAGFKELGLPTPNFKTLSRAQALEAIATFQAKLEQTPQAGAAATRLLPTLKDLAELRPSLIPDTWV